MFDIVPVIQIIAGVVAVAAPIVMLVWLLRGDEPASLANLLAAPDDAAWPHGVQEEEPFRWGEAAA